MTILHDIQKMNTEQLARAKRSISSLHKAGKVDIAFRMEEAIRKREDELEREHLLNCKNVLFKTCTECRKSKPIDNSYFGFGFKEDGAPRAKCKACKRSYNRSYHLENPEIGRVRAQHHQDRRLKIPGLATEQQKIARRREQEDKCAYCGCNLQNGGELDHYIPIEKGGINDINNLVWSCRTCNRDKGAKLPNEFLEYRRLSGLKIRSGGFLQPSLIRVK